MKKTLFVLAVSSLCASAANAQSSVTLYGLLDTGIAYVNNQGGNHSGFKATSNTVNGSRWGLRGSEDLGNGLKGIFTLESGFSVTNGKLGQNDRIFGRQAFVGLSSDQLGTFTLGRQYDNLVDFVGPLSLTGTQFGGTMAAHPFDNDNLNNSFRINNAVKFVSSNYNGLRLGAMYGFSNDAGNFSNNRAYSLGASYNFQGLNLAAAYLQLNNSNPTADALNSNGAVAGDATLLAGRQRTYGGGLSYTFGPATAGFVFTQTRLDNAVGIASGAAGSANNIGLTGNASFNNYEANARYAITPAWSVAGSYVYTEGRIDGVKPKWNQFNIQTSYALSKATDIYLQAAYQQVSSKGLGIGAEIYGLGSASSTNKQVAVAAGIRHRF